MRKLEVLLIALGFGYAVMSLAQSRSFEVASIKPTKLKGIGVQSACHGIDSKFAPRDLAATVPLGRCVISSGRLSHMIGVAYGITMNALEGGPDWVANGEDRYDVEAKAEDPSTATEADLLVMLQRLLADRFKLKFHRETKEVDGFELVVAKGGPKIKQAGPDEEERISLPTQAVAATKEAPATFVLSLQKVSMARLANQLEFFLAGRYVADATNLKGFYDVTLTVEISDQFNGSLQQQLGLRLEPHKIPLEMFVVDYAEKPKPN